LNNKMLFLAVAVLAAVPSPALGQEAPSPEEVVLAFHEALASGDSVTALELLAEDVVIYESGGVEASREEYRSHHLPADMAFTSSTEREVTVEQPVNDNRHVQGSGEHRNGDNAARVYTPRVAD
jgi:ketosteroid isomerase-like protein